MMSKRSPSPDPKRCNGHHRPTPVEPLSARVFRLRIALGYSVYELATVAGILACTVQRLESGKSVDKRALPALATAIGVPLCRLVPGPDCPPAVAALLATFRVLLRFVCTGFTEDEKVVGVCLVVICMHGEYRRHVGPDAAD